MIFKYSTIQSDQFIIYQFYNTIIGDHIWIILLISYLDLYYE